MFARARAWSLSLCCVLSLVTSTPAVAQNALEQTDITLAVGGKGLFYYLPLTIAERLGYFEAAGLKVRIVDFPGGAKSLQAVVGGSAEFAAGSFEHVVNMRARGQKLQAVVLLARYPLMMLALEPAFAARYHSPADLRGQRVGITAPGSSTHLFLNNILTRAGVAPADVPVIGVGAGASAVAAMRRGEIQALVHLDPLVSQLERAGEAVVVIDTRTGAGAEAVFGGAYHAACLYATQAYLKAHPRTTEALVGAQIKALRWLAKASLDDIMAAVPPAYLAADPTAYREALAKNRAAWPDDGLLDRAGAENVVLALGAFEPFVRQAGIDVAELIDNRFGDQARRAP